ncbi:hypothetical protein SCHPADRAFT_133941 [Schizopora paradoxa]|uniref:Uncharacterized protein n=1 Tax=Schizopora paradoxa TaxID=27342 RepID=A0A0H2S115_9AGAM|nr:hypothetical protein SCHPADRAFT_133941 [Schizopora paradoxa]
MNSFLLPAHVHCIHIHLPFLSFPLLSSAHSFLSSSSACLVYMFDSAAIFFSRFSFRAFFSPFFSFLYYNPFTPYSRLVKNPTLLLSLFPSSSITLSRRHTSYLQSFLRRRDR